jgi:Dickkopf-like protein
MIKRLFTSVALTLTLGLAFGSLGVVQAAAECKSDADCKAGTFCILAATPHVCKAPQAAGAACKRDVVCASKKCDIPAGKEAGACK